MCLLEELPSIKRDVCATFMPPSLGNFHEENERKLQKIEIFLSQRGITLSKIARAQ